MKIKIVSKILLLFTLPLLTTFTTAQLQINLETVLKLTDANSLTIQEYQLIYQLAIDEQSKSQEWWMPNLYAGASTHFLNGAAMNTDGKIFTDLSRNNLWAGLGLFAEIDFSKGIYSTLATRQKAQAVSYSSLAEKNKAILKAVQTYFELQAEQLRYAFLQQLVNQSDTLSQQIKIKVDAGLLYQSEYLLSQTNLNHLKISMLEAKAEWQKSSASLASLLNLESNVKLISSEATLFPLAFAENPTANNDFEKRPEFLSLNSELESIQTLRRSETQGLLLPKLKVAIDNGGFGAYSSTFQNTFQINASLLWNIPLSRLTLKSDLKKYDTQLLIQGNKLKQFENQFQQEISTATSQLQLLEEQISLAKQALQTATEALNQSLERQKTGTAKPYEVFQVQQYLLQAQLDYLKSVTEFNKNQYALKVARGENL